MRRRRRRTLMVWVREVGLKVERWQEKVPESSLLTLLITRRLPFSST